jgi:hypothetical protein
MDVLRNSALEIGRRHRVAHWSVARELAQGKYLVPQVGQIDHETAFHDLPTHVVDQLARRAGGAAGCDQIVHQHLLIALGQGVDGQAKAGGVFQQGCDIAKHDSLLGKMRHGADMGLDRHDVVGESCAWRRIIED